jgi:YHS domain-containing protein
MNALISRRHLFGAIAGACLALGLAAPAYAAQPSIFQDDGLAIRGYDPVAYFTQGKPVEGKAAHQLKWRGAIWCFATVDHLEKFKANPEKYAPQYGGYCAYAVSRNYTAKIEPDAWTIHKGKLYLNYNRTVRRLWAGEKAQNIVKGDRNWPAVLNR